MYILFPFAIIMQGRWLHLNQQMIHKAIILSFKKDTNMLP